MQKFFQKYTIVHLIDTLPTGYEYSMEDWPLHITLADVFAIQGDPKELISDLDANFSSYLSVDARVIGDEWFGQDRSVHVKIIDKTKGLQQLHEALLEVLEAHGVTFNSPGYTKEGFRPHSTVHEKGHLESNDIVTFDSVTLIDMFPEENPYQRRVLGTVDFQKF